MSNNAKYIVPSGSVYVEQEIKKSRFITSIGRAIDLSKAKEFINKISNRYADASHNCYAFVAGNPYTTSSIGFGDDGEVSGTAGKPMLNILQHKKIGEIVVVVSRYFGGTKLGTGGLVRAYSSSLQLGLNKLDLVDYVPVKSGMIKFSYNYEILIQQLLRQLDINILNISYSDEVEVLFDIPMDISTELSERIGTITKGEVVVDWI